MIRRSFLRHLTATAAGLLIADDALEMLVEPRRKVWPGWAAGPPAPHAFGDILEWCDSMGVRLEPWQRAHLRDYRAHLRAARAWGSLSGRTFA